MNIFEKLQSEGVNLSQLFAEFISALSEIDDDRSQDADNKEDYMEDEREAAPEDGMLHSYEHEFCDIPMLDIDMVDGDDPAFWRGKEIGIPRAVHVNGYNEKSTLLPIVDGLFRDPESIEEEY
jgi:hypothetical protein